MEAGRATDEIILWSWDLEHTDWAVSTDYRDAFKFLEHIEPYGMRWSMTRSDGEYYVTIIIPGGGFWGVGKAHNLPLAVARAAMGVDKY